MPIINRKKQNREYAKSVQMNVTFPSPAQRAAVQQLIADKSEIEGVNKGVVASSILMNSLLPLRGEEKEIFLACLPDGTEPVYPNNAGIDNALELAFSYASMATGSQYSGNPYEYLCFATKRAWKYKTRLHGYIEGPDPRINLERDFCCVAESDKSASGLFKLIKEDHPEAYPFFNYLFENWNRLKENQNTFSFLAYLCAASENRLDGPEDRQELLEVCSAVQATRIAKRESIKSAAKEFELASMARIPIADNSILVIPGSWTLVNGEKASESYYAGVIEVRNSPNAPHTVFLSPKPIGDLSENDRDAIFAQASLQAPILAAIRNSEVELEYNDDGGVANLEEYNNSPRIGFFSIRESTMFSDKNPAPYGAMIIRAGKEAKSKSE